MSDEAKKKPRMSQPFAIFLAVVGASIQAVQAILIKQASDMSTFELLVIRHATTVGIATPLAMFKGQSFRMNKRTALFVLIRCAFGFGNLLLFYFSLRLIPAADAIAINFASPVFVHIGAWIILREKCRVFSIFLIALTVGGAVLMAKPTFLFSSQKMTLEVRTHLVGCLYALGGSVLSTGVYLSMRKLSTVSPLVIVSYHCLFGCVVSLFACVILDHLQASLPVTSVLFSIAVGLIAVVSQWLFAIALANANAGPVSLAKAAQLVLGFILQAAFFDVLPTAFSIGGSALIVLSTSGLILLEWLLHSKTSNLNCLRRCLCIPIVPPSPPATTPPPA